MRCVDRFNLQAERENHPDPILEARQPMSALANRGYLNAELRPKLMPAFGPVRTIENGERGTGLLARRRHSELLPEPPRCGI